MSAASRRECRVFCKSCKGSRLPLFSLLWAKQHQGDISAGTYFLCVEVTAAYRSSCQLEERRVICAIARNVCTVRAQHVKTFWWVFLVASSTRHERGTVGRISCAYLRPRQVRWLSRTRPPPSFLLYRLSLSNLPLYSKIAAIVVYWSSCDFTCMKRTIARIVLAGR